MSKGQRIKMNKPIHSGLAIKILALLREFQQKTRTIIPHADDLADTVTGILIQTTQQALGSFHVALLNKLEAMKDGSTGLRTQTIDECIRELSQYGSGEPEPPAVVSGDGTDPNE